jgi:glycosyltransferase involved in cell wall biosynthesis
MVIHAYLICFNEERIIGSVLNYYSSFCSKIFVFDNLSTDRSVEIANTYECVTVVPFDTHGKKDDSKHVQIKTEEYKKYSRADGKFCTEPADWVICVDMDELVYHPDLVGVLAKYKEQGVTVPQITGFDMVGEDDIDPSRPLIGQYLNGVREELFDKRAVFSSDFDMSYTGGCHAEGPGFELMKSTYRYKTSNEYPLALLHFKHIGGLLLESAKKNYDRFDAKGIHKVDSDTYVGPGAHYKKYIDMGAERSPLIEKASPVLVNGLVRFDDFPSTTGEQGSLIAGDMSVTEQDVDLVRDAGMKLEKVSIELAYKLMKLANRLRPSGPLIKAKLRAYEQTLSKVKQLESSDSSVK